jgi:hypothetical protein
VTVNVESCDAMMDEVILKEDIEGKWTANLMD